MRKTAILIGKLQSWIVKVKQGYFVSANEISLQKMRIKKMTGSINLLPKDGEVFLFPGFTKEESDWYLISFKRNKLEAGAHCYFRKQVMQPRLTAWYGDEGKLYSYSGITMKLSAYWTKVLQEIKRRIESATGHRFNSALLNLYRDGQDSMGWHRDNEKELGIDPAICSVSFWESRKFNLKHGSEKLLRFNIELTRQPFAHAGLYTASLAARHSPNCQTLQVRINITFRYIVDWTGHLTIIGNIQLILLPPWFIPRLFC